MAGAGHEICIDFERAPRTLQADDTLRLVVRSTRPVLPAIAGIRDVALPVLECPGGALDEHVAIVTLHKSGEHDSGVLSHAQWACADSAEPEDDSVGTAGALPGELVGLWQGQEHVIGLEWGLKVCRSSSNINPTEP